MHNHFGAGLLTGPFCWVSAVIFPFPKAAIFVIIIIIIMAHPYCSSVLHQPAKRQRARGSFVWSQSKSSGISFIWRRTAAEGGDYSTHGQGRWRTPLSITAIEKFGISQGWIIRAPSTPNTELGPPKGDLSWLPQTPLLVWDGSSPDPLSFSPPIRKRYLASARLAGRCS